jgi:hypothetical protein
MGPGISTLQKQSVFVLVMLAEDCLEEQNSFMSEIQIAEQNIDRRLDAAIQALDRVMVEIVALPTGQQQRIGKRAVAELQYQTAEFERYIPSNSDEVT